MTFVSLRPYFLVHSPKSATGTVFFVFVIFNLLTQSRVLPVNCA